ncbi:histidine kinase dimerization/phospho-acceptor domain-containing protein [Hahella sp. SMD15-11]|uniref:histidine kinase n=1 Tax=Thermohahella caldifontis TaxID=3142973 RepID=A0AB39UY78_9GAMM
MKRRGQSIQTRALILGLVPSGFLLLALLWFFTSARLADARQDLVSKGELLAGQVALMSEYDLLTGNYMGLQKQISRGIHQDWVSRVRVLDENGHVVAESEGPDKSPVQMHLIRQPVRNPAVALSNDPFTEFSGLSRSATDVPDRLGEVELTISLDTLNGKRNQIVVNALSLGLVMVLLVLLLVRALVKAISSPLESIHSSLTRLAAGNYGHHMADQDVDGQLGELIDAVNTLSGKLAEQDREMNAHILALEKARKRAETASAAKGEFLALMSHELRTPLNGVIGMLQLLEQTTLSPTQKEYANTALRSAENLLAQISDILNYSLLDRGKVTLDPVPCLATHLVDEVTEAYRDTLEARGE